MTNALTRSGSYSTAWSQNENKAHSARKRPHATAARLFLPTIKVQKSVSQSTY